MVVKLRKGMTPEEYRAYQRESYAKHAEKRRAARKKRYWENPEKARAEAIAYQRRVLGTKPKKILAKTKVKMIEKKSLNQIDLKPGQGHPDNIEFVRKWRE